MRPINSAYDRDSGSATTKLFAALRAAGHEVVSYSTGVVEVDGTQVSSPDWDAAAAAYGWQGDLDAVLAAWGIE